MRLGGRRSWRTRNGAAGIISLGFEGPDVDAEQIVMLARLWRNLGIEGVELHVNSIGDAADRRAHR